MGLKIIQLFYTLAFNVKFQTFNIHVLKALPAQETKEQSWEILFKVHQVKNTEALNI